MKGLKRENIGDMSAKEMAEILNKHRMLFSGIIIISIFLSIIYSFFVAVPIYQARAEVEINKANTGASIIDSIYNSNIIIDELLRQTKELQYAEQLGKALAIKNIHINISDLMTIITSSKGANGRSIILSVKNKEKKETVHVVNTAADTLLELSDQYIKEEIQKQLSIIEDRIKLGRENIEKALLMYNKNKEGSEGIDKGQRRISISEILPMQPIDESLIEGLYDNDLIPSIEVYKSLKMERIRLKIAEEYLHTSQSAYVLSYAEEPISAIWPNKKLIVSASFVVGIGVAFLSAFAIEYFKNTVK